jgi:hypothetical protein
MRASLRRIISADKMRVGLLGKGTTIAESLMGLGIGIPGIK